MLHNYNPQLSGRNKALFAKLRKMLERLQNKLDNGSYARLSGRQRQQLLKRIRRYALRLQNMGFGLKRVATGSALALALALSTPAIAQTFEERSGSDNPFNGSSINTPVPTFVDIDDDGDFDAFVGTAYGAIEYYKNDGTNTSPMLNELFGPENPIGLLNGLSEVAPAFVDVDGDGDYDAFIGEEYGTVKYYKNEGTASAPMFMEQTGANNPLNGIDVGDYSNLAFADIDGDGDYDAFIGEYYGTIKYYQNNGTNTAPMFAEVTGANNPANGIDVGDHATARFVDIDGDGDQDFFSGESGGSMKYYKNEGTTSAPMLVEQTGMNNPFDGEDFGYYANPAFVDIDGDGDYDVFVGNTTTNSITYYENTSTTVSTEELANDLPLEVFPNPSTGIFEIRGVNADRIDVMDIHGRLLRSFETPNIATINIADFPAGMYVLKVKVADQFVTRRVMKNNE